MLLHAGHYRQSNMSEQDLSSRIGAAIDCFIKGRNDEVRRVKRAGLSDDQTVLIDESQHTRE